MPQNPLDTLRSRIARQRATAAMPHVRRADAADVPEDAARPVIDVRPGAAAPSAPGNPTAAMRRPAPLPLPARIVNDWWTRLLQAVYQGSLSEQEERYESHSTTRDYLWNTLGTSIWGASFPVLTIVATQLAGTEQAGMFSMAFVMGTLLMIAAQYGVRTFQVSDIDEATSFASYQMNRWLTGLIALTCGIAYGALRGYDAAMMTICAGVFIYKFVDGIADVYEGRLQQADKLYLAGISQTVRSVAACTVFSFALLLTRTMSVAAVAMAVAAVASLVLLTVPLALLETERSRRGRLPEVTHLLVQCFPLFAATFLFNLIESIPKFVMEGALPYENQLFFNALYFPAQGILLAIGFIYKPQLVRLASIWASPKKRRRFDLVIAAVLAVVVGITVAVAAFMGWLGIPLMSFMYGVDFEPFRGLAFAMVAAGGVTAAIDFIYAIITILRRQRAVMRLYLISFAAALVLSLVLVNLIGLTGAVASYLGTMALLLVLLIREYVRIRRAITRERNPFQ